MTPVPPTSTPPAPPPAPLGVSPAAHLDDAALDRAVAEYRARGYARLGRLADDATLEALRARVNAIMLGEVSYDGLFFQLDAPTGRYEDLEIGKGFRGPSLSYRKIEKLEKDPLFLAWLRSETFERVARRVFGDARVTLYRAVVFSKDAQGGSPLPFHQDAGDFWGLDRVPELQIWTALDDAPLDGGCLELVPGSHLEGLATRNGGVVPKNIVDDRDAERRVERVPVPAGESMLIHNLVWHRSGRGRGAGTMRRAFTSCYLHGETTCRRKKHTPRSFFEVWPAVRSS